MGRPDRPAGLADVHEIAAAHLDSIRSIGPLYYPAQVVSDWGARVTGDLYVNAMASGETIVQVHGQSPLQFNYINPDDDPGKSK